MSGEGPDKGKKGGRGPYVMQTRRIEAAYGAGANEDDIDRPVGVSGALPMSGPVRPSRQGPQARGPTFPDRRTLRRRASEQQSAWTSFFFFCAVVSLFGASGRRWLPLPSKNSSTQLRPSPWLMHSMHDTPTPGSPFPARTKQDKTKTKVSDAEPPVVLDTAA